MATCLRLTRKRAAVDPGVAEALFNEEVAAMSSRARYGRGGWLIVSASFPDLIVELPHPSGARRRFRFRCDGWDEQPPSVKSVDGDGMDLVGQPTGDLFMGLNGGYGLCRPGTREYHHHHMENPWANHRGNTGLDRIVVRVASAYRKANA
jgi:hypothetical protein